MHNDIVRIDPAIPGFKGFGHASTPDKVTRPDAVAQTVVRVIGETNAFFLCGERSEIRDGAKDLFACSHVVQ